MKICKKMLNYRAYLLSTAFVLLHLSGDGGNTFGLIGNTPRVFKISFGVTTQEVIKSNRFSFSSKIAFLSI
jgi:hypothetical protein